MFHLCGYTLLIGTAVDTDVPAIQDDILAIQNSHFLPQGDMAVRKLWVGSPTILRAKLNSPKIRQINPTFIRPLNNAILPANNPNYQRYDGEQLVIKAQEELQVLGTANPAVTERFTALAWLQTSYEPIPVGDVYWCRLTSTGTATVNAWTTIAYTLDTLLPQGQYAMISSEMQSTNAIAHRWIFSNQYLRPGNISLTSLNNRIDYDAYNFDLGQMGKFVTYDLPRLQVLCNVADASHEGYFAVVRLGPAPPTFGT